MLFPQGVALPNPCLCLIFGQEVPNQSDAVGQGVWTRGWRSGLWGTFGMEENKPVLCQVASAIVVLEGICQFWWRHIFRGVFRLVEEKSVELVLDWRFLTIDEVEPAVCASSAALAIVQPGLLLTCVEEMDVEFVWKSVSHLIGNVCEIYREQVCSEF